METAPPAQVVSDPDTGLMTDERLVTLVRQSGLQPARDELLARTAQQRAKLLRRLARDAGLSEADRSDVQQEAVLWTLEAIQHYDRGSAAPSGCSFRSFLHRVITCRFIDFLRHRLRYQRHFILIGVTHPTDLDVSISRSRTGSSYPEVSEQLQEFEEDELSEQLRSQLDRLDVRARRLWGLLAGGATVLEISAVLRISYDAAKRRRRKLLLHLRKALVVSR